MSLMTREDMLRELELLPVWQLREPVQLKTQVAIDNASAAPPVEYKSSVPEAVLQQIAPEIEVPLEISQAAPAPNVPEQVPLRLLLSEDAAYAFVMAAPNDDANVQAVETLLQNMLKAIKVICRLDITNTSTELFAEHRPKLIVSMGEVPANALLGVTHTVAEWRNLQLGKQIRYEDIPMIVTYHPEYLLQNLGDKAKAWEDLCLAKRTMQSL